MTGYFYKNVKNLNKFVKVRGYKVYRLYKDISVNESEGTAAGMLLEYANPQLQSEEKEAWKKAVVEKA